MDRYHGAIVSIGPLSDAVLDRFGISDLVIPKLRVLTQTIRSSRWEETLRKGDWGLTYEQAANLSQAMYTDISRQVQSVSPVCFFGRPISS